jgi:hypothetical protein
MKFTCAGETFDTAELQSVSTRHPGLCLYITPDRRRVFVQTVRPLDGVTFHEADSREITHLRSTFEITELDDVVTQC